MQGRQKRAKHASNRWQNARCRRSSTTPNLPLYSMPHLSLTMTILPVRSLRNGFGLTGTAAWGERLFWMGRGERERERRGERGDENSATERHTKASLPCSCFATSLFSFSSAYRRHSRSLWKGRERARAGVTSEGNQKDKRQRKRKRKKREARDKRGAIEERACRR